GETAALEVERARVAVVGENDPGRDHDAVGDGHAGAHVHLRVDLDVVADGDAVGDVGLLADDAIAADACGSADVDVVPNRGALAELDAGLDEGRLVNPRPTSVGR